MEHTWHPNTFGLFYGRKTTRTACSLRRPPGTLVPNLETTCPKCQDEILRHMLEMQAICLTVIDLRRAGLIPPLAGKLPASHVPGVKSHFAVI